MGRKPPAALHDNHARAAVKARENGEEEIENQSAEKNRTWGTPARTEYSRNAQKRTRNNRA